MQSDSPSYLTICRTTVTWPFQLALWLQGLTILLKVSTITPRLRPASTSTCAIFSSIPTFQHAHTPWLSLYTHIHICICMTVYVCAYAHERGECLLATEAMVWDILSAGGQHPSYSRSTRPSYSLPCLYCAGWCHWCRGWWGTGKLWSRESRADRQKLSRPDWWVHVGPPACCKRWSCPPSVRLTAWLLHCTLTWRIHSLFWGWAPAVGFCRAVLGAKAWRTEAMA